MSLNPVICPKCRNQYAIKGSKKCPICPEKPKKPRFSKDIKTIAVSDCCGMGYVYLGYGSTQRMCFLCKQECGLKILRKIVENSNSQETKDMVN